ncbi:MAG: SRPBCC family protein [Saprospirales bacterium]|nr:SRPBCC family protein [Saprospirales bacterium]
MKTLRIIIGVLLALIVLYLLLCLVGPKKVMVTRTAEIGAPASVIYGYLYDFKEWKKWSPWQLKDQTIQNTYVGPLSGVGSINSWTSEKSGAGSQEITEAEIPTLLKTKLQFNDWDGYSIATFLLEEKDGCKTKVSWSMDGDKDVPFFFRAMMIFMNRSVASDYSDGLQNLKSLSEEQVANLPNSYRG